MRLLCIGQTGQVARSLCERSDALGINLVARGRPELDLSKPETLEAVVAEYQPSIIINAAAYTAVDQAETDREAAFAINAEAVKKVARIADESEIPLIHISTDYVFDGSNSHPYSESDPVNPLGVYGASKFAGEEAVRSFADRHIILRTAWVFSPFGKNFVKTMLRLAADRDSVSVVSDQYGNPTSAIDIADGILQICGQISNAESPVRYGTYHMTGSGAATWADLAESVFEIYEQNSGKKTAVSRISSAEYPTPVERPKNSVLDCTKLEAGFGIRLPDWQDSVRSVVSRLVKERT